MIKTILLTGATGFIGSHLLEALIENDYNVVILKRSFSDTWRIDNIIKKVKSYDIDKCDLNKPFEENNIDCVINLATDYGRSKKSSPSTILKTNVIMPLELAEQAVKSHVKCFWNIDSYWNTGKSLDESLNLYAYSKKIFLEILKNQPIGKIQIFNLKLFHVFGEKDNMDKFLPFAVSKLQSDEALKMTKGEQRLDFIYVKELARMFSFILKNMNFFPKPFEAFEIGSGKVIPLAEVIGQVKKELHSKSIIHFGAIPRRKNEILYACANVQNLIDKGYRPKYTLKDGIKALCAR